MALIKTENLTLSYENMTVIKELSFEANVGDYLCIVGENGSGKSTLLKIISGALRPTAGTVAADRSKVQLLTLGTGFDMELTARENVLLNGTLMGYSESFMKEHFEEIIDFAQLWEFLDMPIKNYSSGMEARLGFAVATMVRPDILICDEVLAVGDYKFQEKCEERMRQMLDSGTTLLYVSHQNESVEKLCDHAVWIEKGHIRMQGNVNEVSKAYLSE